MRRNDSQLFHGDHGRQEARKDASERIVGDVPEGDRPVAGQAPSAAGRRGRRRAAAARRPAPVAAPPPRRPPRRSPPRRPRRVRRDAADLSAAASVDLTDAATDYPGDNASQAELAKWLAGAGAEGRACRPSCR